MEGLFMGPSLVQAVEGFRGVVDVAECLAVGEGSVVGGKKKWLHGGLDGTSGDQPL